MAKLMSKSELIQKLADEHSDKLTRKDVKGVLESLAQVGYKELKKTGSLPGPGLRQVRRDQEAGDQGAQGHQPLHEGADDLQGQAGPQGHQGPPGQGRQRRGDVVDPDGNPRKGSRTLRAASSAVDKGKKREAVMASLFF